MVATFYRPERAMTLLSDLRRLDERLNWESTVHEAMRAKEHPDTRQQLGRVTALEAERSELMQAIEDAPAQTFEGVAAKLMVAADLVRPQPGRHHGGCEPWARSFLIAAVKDFNRLVSQIPDSEATPIRLEKAKKGRKGGGA
jgi:hypothetical protein